jgi:hypothetical protein
MDPAHPTFREADTRRLAAEQHARAGRKTQAIDAFTAAVELFRQVPQAMARGRGASGEGPPQPLPLPSPIVPPQPSQPNPSTPVEPVARPETGTETDKPAVVPPRPAIDTIALERQAVLGVLRQFADGYNSMSVGTMQKVFPTLDTQVYARTFSSFSALDWRYENPVITLMPNGSEAEVNTQVTIVQTPRRGRELPPDRRIKRFVLRKQPQGWVIVENVDLGPAR